MTLGIGKLFISNGTNSQNVLKAKALENAPVVNGSSKPNVNIKTKVAQNPFVSAPTVANSGSVKGAGAVQSNFLKTAIVPQNAGELTPVVTDTFGAGKFWSDYNQHSFSCWA